MELPEWVDGRELEMLEKPEPIDSWMSRGWGRSAITTGQITQISSMTPSQEISQTKTRDRIIFHTVGVKHVFSNSDKREPFNSEALALVLMFFNSLHN